MEKKTWIQMEYDEFDSMIHQNYGEEWKDYEIIADEELHNYTYVGYRGIDGEEIKTDWDKNKMKDPKSMYHARLLLNDMCRRKIIEPGDYLIQVYW